MLILSTKENPAILSPAFQQINAESTPAKGKLETAEGLRTNIPNRVPFPAKDLVMSTGFVSTGGKTEVWNKEREQTAVILYKPDGTVLSVFEISQKSKTRRYIELDALAFEEKYGFHMGINPVIISKLVNKILQPLGSPEAEIINNTQREVMTDLVSAYKFEGIETYSFKYRDADIVKLSFNIKKQAEAEAIFDTLKMASSLYKFSVKPEKVENDETLNALNAFEKDVIKYVETRGYEEDAANRMIDAAKEISKNFKEGSFSMKVADLGNWIDMHASTFELLGKYTHDYQAENKKELLTRVASNEALSAFIEDKEVSTEFGGYLFAQSKVHGPIVVGNHVLPIANQFKLIEGTDLRIATLGKKLTGISIEERKKNPSADTNKLEGLSPEGKEAVIAIVAEINEQIVSLSLGEKLSPNELLQFPMGKNLLVRYAALERRASLDYDSLIHDDRRLDKRIKLPRSEKGFDYSLVMNMENHKLNNLPILLVRRDSAYSLVGDEKDTKDLRRKITYVPLIILGNNSAAAAIPNASLYEKISNAVVMLEKVTPDSNTYTYDKVGQDEDGSEKTETVTAEVDVDKYIDIIISSFSDGDALLLGKGNIEELIKPLMEAKLKDNSDKFKDIYSVITERANKSYFEILEAAVAPGSRGFINAQYQAKFVKYHSDLVGEQIKEIREGMRSEEATTAYVENATFPSINFTDDISDERKTLTRKAAVSFQYLMIQMRMVVKSIQADLYTQGAADEKAQLVFQNKLNARTISEDNRFSFFTNKAPDLLLTKSVEGVIFATNHLKAPERWADIQARGQETKYLHKVDKILGGRNAKVFEAKNESEVTRIMTEGIASYELVIAEAKELTKEVRVSQLANASKGGGEEKTERRSESMKSGLENMRLSMGKEAESPVYDDTVETQKEEIVKEESETVVEGEKPLKKRVKKVEQTQDEKVEDVDYAALSAVAITESESSAEDTDNAAALAAFETIGIEDLEEMDSSVFFVEEEDETGTSMTS